MTQAQFLQFFASYSLQSALVIGLAAGIDRWSHASTTKARVWTCCFVSLLGLFAAGMLLPHVQWGNPWNEAPPNEVVAILGVEHEAARLVLAVWALGTAVMAVRAVINFFRIQRFVARLPRVPTGIDAHLRSLVGAEACAAGGKEVEFRLSPEEVGPFCYQFHRPMVFLPESLLLGNHKDLCNVLKHELTHLRTEHPMQVFLQKTTQCVLWFHPLVWMASGRTSIVREFVCDDAASQHGASTAAYLRSLLSTIERQRHACQNGLHLGDSASQLRRRVARLASQKCSENAPSSFSAAAAVVAASCLASLLWLPVDPLVSSRSGVSPWPKWSATALQALNLPAHDFQPYDGRANTYELELAKTRQQSRVRSR